jgi:hypothetical protein
LLLLSFSEEETDRPSERDDDGTRAERMENEGGTSRNEPVL